MYKYIGFGLSGLFLLMVMPSAFDPQIDQGLNLYGTATLVQQDSEGSEVFKQTVHNRLVDTGETFILFQTFQDSTTVAEANQIGSICVSTLATLMSETATSGAFANLNTFASGSNCVSDGAVDTQATTGKAVVGALVFQAATHVPSGGVINSIGVCSSNGPTATSFQNCNDPNNLQGVLFAHILTSAVTLNTDESVDITYTFDITSTIT